MFEIFWNWYLNKNSTFSIGVSWWCISSTIIGWESYWRVCGLDLELEGNIQRHGAVLLLDCVLFNICHTSRIQWNHPMKMDQCWSLLSWFCGSMNKFWGFFLPFLAHYALWTNCWSTLMGSLGQFSCFSDHFFCGLATLFIPPQEGVWL